MNSTATQYDTIAKDYGLANRFGTLEKSHALAFTQIQNAQLGEQRQQYKILDLGVGDGIFLQKLKALIPQADLTGIDLSAEMLKKAKQGLNFLDIHGDSQEADKYLPLHMQDLVIAHFINAYMPIKSLFQQAKWMTKANGHFSYITSTYDSFPSSQMQLAKFVAEDSFLGSIVGHYYKKIVEKTPVASGLDEIMQEMQHFGFTVCDHERIHIPVYFEHIDDMIEFGIKGSWFLNTLSAGPTPLPKQFIIERFKRVFHKIFHFPYHDEQIVDIFLAKK
jgi:ubiquinone/menaquinone biosynthesis C-methylase UbiE